MYIYVYMKFKKLRFVYYCCSVLFVRPHSPLFTPFAKEKHRHVQTFSKFSQFGTDRQPTVNITIVIIIISAKLVNVKLLLASPPFGVSVCVFFCGCGCRGGGFGFFFFLFFFKFVGARINSLRRLIMYKWRVK